jgi:glutamine amidotransferase-like uncharacterized protein
MNSGQWSRSASSFSRGRKAPWWDWWIAALLAILIPACAMPLGSAGPAASQSNHPPTSHRNGGRTDVLLFSGAASWGAEVDSLAEILLEHGVTYQEATSEELNAMSSDELAGYSLLIVPGGDAPTLTASLTTATHAKLRYAVQSQGLNYLGFCAGAWAAIAPAPAPGGDVSYGLGIVDGPVEQQNYLSKQGREFAISRAAFPDGSQRDLLWYGGPVTPDTPGGVIAKYADGTPAISQMWSGQGFVIVSGLHPAANVLIMNALGLNDPEAIDPDFAWKLLNSGLNRLPLPAF